MIKMAEYAKRRKKLMQKIGPKGIAILASAPIGKRNGDYEYPYRQNSDFYYLTGFAEPYSVALLIPKGTFGEFILFNRKKNRAEEIWEGQRAGLEGARQVYGADQAFPIEELEARLPLLLDQREQVHYALGENSEFDRILLQTLGKIRSRIRNGLHPPLCFLDITETIHEMRLTKSPAEINAMRHAAKISALAHRRAIKFCRPGIAEYQLEAEILHEFHRHDARHPAYTSIVGSGANSCILHYTDNNQIVKEGDVVLIDAGAEYQSYAADITRTFPANGKFTKEQRAIYEIVLRAQKAGIAAIRPGTTWPAVQDIIIKIITEGLLKLGILKGRLTNLIEQQAYLPFYMHKAGHWLGLDVHDVGRYKIRDKWRSFQPGMVLTVEPGIYISSDIPKVAKRWHNIGVRIEDDVLVTSKGYEILSSYAPKEIDEIEALMAGN